MTKKFELGLLKEKFFVFLKSKYYLVHVKNKIRNITNDNLKRKVLPHMTKTSLLKAICSLIIRMCVYFSFFISISLKQTIPESTNEKII